MKTVMELARSVILQSLVLAVLLWPVFQWSPLSDRLVAVSAGFLMGVGTTLQFVRQRRDP